MTLEPGTRLGPYEIIAPLGAGGMGEVYRARDTKLGRDVALKVLPPGLALDRDRLARFQREAHVLAVLNHPHIAQIHGLEDGGAQMALVMELVEGRTLADRISEGSIPLDEALAIAKQIAEALAAAHDHGIVHRDLKPANIKIRDDGTVKVLDFGLAKAIDVAVESTDIVNSPTLTSPLMTRQGVVLGTAAYMAPEQARGRSVDKRADIWAFGVVLLEMLTGRRPFAGDDVTDTIAAIVKTQPDLSQVPLVVRRLLSRCLEKDPTRRLRDLGDAWDLLENPSATAVGGRASRWPLVAGVVVAAAAVGYFVWAARTWRDRPHPAPIRFVEAMPELRTIPRGIGWGSAVAIAPDARALVYSAREDGQSRLYRRFLGQLDAEPIGDLGAVEPFFSPDGLWVGFVLGRTLKRVSVQGGPPETLAQLPEAPLAVRGICWNADGTIIVGGVRELWRVSRTGTPIETLVTAPENKTVFSPQLLPGGRAVLYTERTLLPQGQVADKLLILDLNTRNTKPLLSGTAGRYLPTGHVVFGRGGALWAATFDINRLDVSGDAVPIIEGIRWDGGPVAATVQFAVADAGALAYVSAASVQQHRSLVWVNRLGHEQSVGAEPRAYANPRVSPDGKRIAVAMRDEGRDIWIWDVERRLLKQLTTDRGPNWLAAWFPDSKRLAFSAAVDQASRIFEQAVDGSGNPRLLTEQALPTAISRDGTVLLFMEPVGLQWDLGALPLQNLKGRRTLRQTPEIERNAVISPDGRWIAYESERSGRSEIFVRPYPDIDAAEHKVTTEGGMAPVWGRDGRELFYWHESGPAVSIRSVAIVPGRTFDFGMSQTVIQGRFARPSPDTQYDIAPDGRFVILKPVGPPRRDEIVTVMNWFEELKRPAAGK